MRIKPQDTAPAAQAIDAPADAVETAVEPAGAAAPSAPQAPHRGGSFVRMPDGSLEPAHDDTAPPDLASPSATPGKEA